MNDTILTMDEVAEILKMSRSQVYSLTRRRGQVRMGEDAIPFFKLNGNIRFSKNAINLWLARLTEVA